MKVVICAGPPTSGKTTVLKQAAARLINKGFRLVYLKIDVQYADEDELFKEKFNIPSKKVYSGDLCPDHCTAIQLFTKNANQWRGKPFEREEIERFAALRKESNIFKILAHNAYLINLASSDHSLRMKSIHALTDEMGRCRILAIPCIIIHPGAHIGAGEDEGIRNIINSLNIIMDRAEGNPVDIALETTAGQGTNIGYRFEHLARIIDGVKDKEKIKVCLDTCHIFAAGYDSSTAEGYDDVIKEFDRLVGIGRLVCFHVNDCKKGLGSRVDRHEHIGKGALGQLPFRLLMNDKRFADIPKIIETPKDKDMKNDRRNLGILRKMAEDKK